MKTLSIVIPCYNEAPSIELFYQAIQKMLANNQSIMSQIQTELIFIDDGSTDQTLHEIKTLKNTETLTVHYVSFSRNFGKESGLAAGLQTSKGDYVVVMDVDLQDPPELIPQMLTAIQTEGYDCVGTLRVNRKGEPPIRSFFSKAFYKLINKISGVEIVPNARDYRMMTWQMVNAILSMPEYNRFSKGIFSWVGFKTKYLKFKNTPRAAGETHWSFWQLFTYSMEAIIDFSDVPLQLATFTGLLFSAIAGIAAIFVIIRKIFFGDSVGGWASMVTIVLFIGGIQLFCLGILGNYLGKVYLESKHRPLYIIKEKQ